MLLFWQTYFLDSEMLGHQENMTNVIYFLLIYDSLQVYNNQKQNQYGRLYLASLKTAILKLLQKSEDYGTCTCIFIFPLINSYIKSRFNKALDTDSLDNIGKI